ncbi:MAG: hypothetical protein JW818_08705 [Pirellulales bacterium]|nr:hypothetical protein [Pirellulales bacterium]
MRLQKAMFARMQKEMGKGMGEMFKNMPTPGMPSPPPMPAMPGMPTQ